MFDEDQKTAFDLANIGHNMTLTGQAGTGKTFLIKHIVRKQRKRKNVAIVCSTGIASTLYGELGAQTLHRWAGIEDGRYLNEEIIHLVQTDERFISVKQRIQSTDLLIIDEVSMISAKTLNQVALLCKNIRNNDKHFGGMQVILSGDFYQLPPVQNKLIGDPGNYCFKLSWFSECFPHQIQLNIIHRQTETMLIQCINQLEKGEPTDESVAFLKSLDRPLPNEEKSVQLFARNYDVDIFNYNKIQDLPGELKTYPAIDEGSDFYLRKFLAPKNLGVKVGCRVMLVRNLSDTLVNGLCGTVTRLHQDSVDVKFEIDNKISVVTIKPVVFTTYDPVDKIFVAKRTQVPLKLAYAITVHKAQGMSLKSVVVNCEYCFQPGQIGVAVGRAETVDGIRVLNFRKSLCRQHPAEVRNFYKNSQVGTLFDDLSCCKGKEKDNSMSGDDDDDNDDFDNECSRCDDDSDFSESEIENIEIIESFVEDNILTEDQSVSSAKTALDSVFNEFIGSPLENQMKLFKLLILENFQSFNEWYQNQVSIVEDLGLNTLPEGVKTHPPKQQSDFFLKFHKYLNSDEYINAAESLLSVYCKDKSAQPPQYQFLTTMLFYIERKFFEDLPSHMDLQEPPSIKDISIVEGLSAPARGKVRYVSGYVLAKLKYKLSVKIRSSLFAEGSEEKVTKLQDQMKIFASLCSSYDELKYSNDPESLLETKRKQNERESLTNITDISFEFFGKLEVLCRSKLTHINLVKYGKHLYNFVIEELEKDKDLFEFWVQTLTSNYNIKYTSSDPENICSIIQSLALSCENYLEIFHSAVRLFLTVSFSQFRRDYLTFLKKEKGKALRKKVTEKSKKNVKSFNMQFLKDDTSKNKEGSHLRLKSEIIQNEKFLSEKSFKIKDLLVLCEMYNVKIPAQKRKDVIACELTKVIIQSDNIPCHQKCSPSSSASVPEPEIQNKEQSQPQKRKKSKEGKGRGRGTSRKKPNIVMDESEDKCAICNKPEKDDGEDWICCDNCSLWFHRNCANLEDDDMWNSLQEEGVTFTCPFCQ